MNKTLLCKARTPYLQLFRRSPSPQDGNFNLRGSQNCRCICQKREQSDSEATRPNQERGHSWQNYVKLRKYGLLGPTWLSYGVPLAASSSKWREVLLRNQLHHSLCQFHRFYSTDNSDSGNVGSQKTPKRRRRKPENPTPIPTPVSPPLSYSSLPDEVKADLQSLNHLSGTDDLKRRLDPQEFSAVNTKIIEDFLKESDVPYERGHTSFLMRCPRFVKSRAVKALKENSRLYVNSMSGYFECRACGKSGKWDSLVQNLNDITKRKGKKPSECFATLPVELTSYQAPEEVTNLYNSSTSLSTLQQTELSEILEEFGMQKIKVKTLLQHGVTYDEQSGSLLFPYFGYNKLLVGLKIMTAKKAPLVHAEESVAFENSEENEDEIGEEESDSERENQDAEEESIDQEKREVQIETQLLPSNLIGLFGYAPTSSKSKRNKDVILTNSEIDAMAISQETGQLAVCLPNGVEGLKQELLPIFETFGHVTIWFGGDMQSWDAAKEYGCRLNQNRCSIIRPDMENSNAYQCLVSGTKLKEILNKKSEMVHKAIIDFRKLRREVYTEMSQEKTVAGVQWQRYSAFNKIMKGHRRGELTVFTGPTGAGKTTFISDYSLDLCMQGVRTLWGSFEVNNVRLLRSMLSQYARENLSHNLEKFDFWANNFEELPMYFMTFHGQEELEVVIDTMAHAAYVYNIHHVVIDNLQFMMGMAKNALDRFFQQDHAIQKLRQFATDYNIHVTLVMHPRKEVPGEDLSLASIFGGAKATQEADNVLILQDRRLVSTRGRKYLQIVKNRYAGDLSILGLKFNKESISFDVLLPDDKRKKKSEDEPSDEVVEEEKQEKVLDVEETSDKSAFQNFFQG